MTPSTELVVTGLGVVSSAGFGLPAHWQAVTDPVPRKAEDYHINAIEVRDYISDRRMLKAISPLDGIGLAAIVGLKKHMQLSPGLYHPDRIGLYVGSTPSSLTSLEPYLDAMRDGAHGFVSERDFGLQSQRSRPMTLLVGLLNNVLCYGSMLLEARGPNSNYTSLLLGAHHALIHGAKRLQRDQADLIVAGGYSSRSHPADQAGFKARGLVRSANAAGELAIEPFAQQSEQDGLVFADAATFIALERREAAQARRAPILARYCGGTLRSDARGVLNVNHKGEALADAIETTLQAANVAKSEIGLVFASATGVTEVDSIEANVLSQVFAETHEGPAVACLSAVYGSGMEAGGILEIGLMPHLYDAGLVPGVLRARSPIKGLGHKIDSQKPYSLIVRTSPWGEYSSVLIKRELS